jgi:two-component system nitrate/nitrite sensor histidine kinase NarX
MALRLSSIRSRLILLLLAFFLLVIVSVGATFWSLEDQKRDALMVNLAGRQRMLVQQMRREALAVAMQGGDASIQALGQSMDAFGITLAALRDGGEVPFSASGSVTIPPARAPGLDAQLDEVQAWWEAYQQNLLSLLALSPESPDFQAALEQVERLSPDLVQQSDLAVRLLERSAEQKVARLRWIQAIFLWSALLLLAVGAWMVRNDVARPLADLGRIARRIGGGDLGTPIQASGLDEVRQLKGNFDQMRLQLLDSKEQLQAWADKLEGMVAQRIQELEALYAVSRDISSRLLIDDVLSSITQKTRGLLQCDVAVLCLFNDADQTMTLLSSSGPEEAIMRRTSQVRDATTRQVLAGERALRCAEGCRGFCEILSSPYHTSHIVAPLKIEQQIIGALCVGDEQPEKFGEDAMNVLTKLANVAAIALQNARLYDQAERLAASEERQRIAAEMHDGLAQTLSYTKLKVNQSAMQLEAGQVDAAMRTLDNVSAALNRAIEDTRRAIASLQEQGPPTETLQDQLARLAMEFSRDDLKVEWSSAVASPVKLLPAENQQVLRVAQEALLNAKRHSSAKHIGVHLEQINGDYRLVIEDDGQGFDPDAELQDDGQQHFGLNIMSARASRIAGRLQIQSAPGHGTRVCLDWPRRSEGT